MHGVCCGVLVGSKRSCACSHALSSFSLAICLLWNEITQLRVRMSLKEPVNVQWQQWQSDVG